MPTIAVNSFKWTFIFGLNATYIRRIPKDNELNIISITSISLTIPKAENAAKPYKKKGIEVIIKRKLEYNFIVYLRFIPKQYSESPLL